ncbi:MAG TPA: potassium channel protein [Burkholderiales bacterium]
MTAELLLRIARAFYAPLLALIAVTAVATTGYLAIAGPNTTVLDALYMTYITIFTIGYEEVVPLKDNPGGRIFNMAIGTIGIATVGYVMARATAFIVESDIDQLLRRRRMLDKIQKLSGHYVVCGIGRVGSNVLRELIATGRQSVVIEPEQSALDAMLEANPKQLFLHGDGGDDDLLRAAGVERAAGVFAVSGDDNKNLVITLSAKQLNPRARVVARCHDVRFVDKIRRVGADDIVSPDYTGALRIASSMLRPAVVSFLDEMLRSDKGLRVEEIAVPASAAERRVAEVAPPDPDYVVLALRREGRWEFNPRTDSWAMPGTTIIVMATPEGRSKLERLVSARV